MTDSNITIRQEQRDKAQEVLGLFQRIKEIKNKYPKAIKYLESIYLPSFSRNVEMPPMILIENKILAEILISDEARDKEAIKTAKKTLNKQ